MYLGDVVRASAVEIRRILGADGPAHARLRSVLVAIAAATVGIDLACAALALVLERHARGTDIHTYGDALFWTSTQLLTVSSQIPDPLTVGGRILDVAMEAYAISVVASLAGAMGAFLVHRAHEDDRGA